jgi:FkbM family methyltransferase
MSGFNFNNGVVTIKQCKYGDFAFYNADSPIGHCLSFYGEWAEEELSFIAPHLQPNSNVIDVGANIGTHTVFFSKKCPQGQIHAIEPQFYIFQILTTNVAINARFNVKPYNVAISNDYDSLKLLNFPPMSQTRINYGEFKVHNSENGIETRCMKLDQFDNIQFIKLDVEGYELECLKSGVNLIEKCKPKMYIEFNNKKGNPELISFLWDHGYVCYWHVSKKFSPDNFNRNSTNIWLDDQNQQPTIQLVEKFFEGNIFCVHKSQKVKKCGEVLTDKNDNYVEYLKRNGTFQ